MEELRARRFVLAATGWAVLAAAVLGTAGYVDRKGFNPSDDGVVLAQSYRILQGQMPHRDFVTIRPALSGVLHTVNFAGVFPLVESGRIMVLFEVFLTAFAWAWVLCRHFQPGGGSALTVLNYSSLGILAFFLGLNSGIIFPWTTIDAITFSVLGFTALLAASHAGLAARRQVALLSVGLLLNCLAVLCRQTFAAMALAAAVLCALLLIRCARPRLLLVVIPVGTLPLAAYLGLAAATGAWSALWSQLSGRVELIPVGVTRYARSLLANPAGWVHLAVLLLTLLAWCLGGRFAAGRTPAYARLRDRLSRVILWGYALYAVLLAVRIVATGLSGKSFGPFWALGVWTLVCLVSRACTFAQLVSLLFALVLSWTASISIGANSPLLGLGILITTILAAFGRLLHRWYPSPGRRTPQIAFACAIAILAAGVAPFGLLMQLQRNYRDLPSRELTHELGRLLPAFGHIKTNARTYAYFSDLVNLYNEHPGMKNHMVVAPNNAIIYPVLRTRSPFPLDWLQQDEFVGLEATVLADIETVLARDRTYVLVEKCDSKRLAEGLYPAPVSQTRYPYLNLLFTQCRIVDDRSPYFTLLVSSGSGNLPP